MLPKGSVKRRKHPRLMCPKRQEGKAFIYLLGLSDGRVKVGFTTSPRGRIQSHRQWFDIHWIHFFSPAPGFARVSESYALQSLAAIGKQIGKTEIFSGISKADAIRAAREGIESYRAWLVECDKSSVKRDAELAAWLAFRAQYFKESEAA